MLILLPILFTPLLLTLYLLLGKMILEGAASLIYLLRSERGGFLYWKKGGMRAFVLVVRRIIVLKEENTVWRDVCTISI